MIIFARYTLFLVIASIVVMMLGFYGRTKDKTLLAMGAIVLVAVAVDTFVMQLSWVVVVIALLASISIGLSARKR